MTIKDRITAAKHTAGVWLNALLLAAFPFTSDIIQGVNDNLPSLAPYLPPNVYKVVGFVVVAFNLIYAIRRARRSACANRGAHG